MELHLPVDSLLDTANRICSDICPTQPDHPEIQRTSKKRLVVQSNSHKS